MQPLALEEKSSILKHNVGRPKKKVSFSSHANVRNTLSRNDYTVAEINLTWYTSKENMNIQRSCIKQILKMEAGEICKDQKYCSRGLEIQTKTGHKARKYTRHESFDAVLDQQDANWSRKRTSQDQENKTLDQINRSTAHLDDDEAIARVYRQFSSSCQIWANVVGLADARAVQNYLLDEVEEEDPESIKFRSNLKASMKKSVRTPVPTTRAPNFLPLPNMSYARTA